MKNTKLEIEGCEQYVDTRIMLNHDYKKNLKTRIIYLYRL